MIKVQRNSKGFTLIELLIVIAIIGILAAVAIPAYTGSTKKARLSEVTSAMGAVKNGIVARWAEAGTLPAACATAAAIGTALGVTPPTNYATFTTAADGTVTATITMAGWTGGTTITLAPADTSATSNYTTWTWGGTADPIYIPKT